MRDMWYGPKYKTLESSHGMVSGGLIQPMTGDGMFMLSSTVYRSRVTCNPEIMFTLALTSPGGMEEHGTTTQSGEAFSKEQRWLGSLRCNGHVLKGTRAVERRLVRRLAHPGWVA